MKNRELIEFYRGLNCVGHLRGLQFQLAVIQNLHKLRPEIEMLQSVRKIPASYLEFDKGRVELVKQCSRQDEKGNALFVNGNYQLDPAKIETFNAEFQALQEKHKEAIVEFTAAEQEYNDMLNLDRNDVVIRKAKTESLPADISGEQLMSIWPMIEEEKKNAER